MNPQHKVKRFRANPVEVAIFSVVTLLFFHSLYALLYDTRMDYSEIFATSRAIASFSDGGRAPASIAPASLMTLELKCEDLSDQSTSASKIRVNGNTCGHA